MQYLPLWVFCTIIRLCHCPVSLLRFVRWYLFIYIYIEERTTSSCKTLLFYQFGEKLLCYEALSFSSSLFRLTYGSEMLSSCTTFIVLIETTSVNISFWCIIWYVNRNNCVVKTPFILCLLLKRGHDHVMNPCNKSLLKYLYLDIYLFWWNLICNHFQQFNYDGYHSCYYVCLLTCMCDF